MSRIDLKNYHREAMQTADKAFSERNTGNFSVAKELFRKAFEQELKACEMLKYEWECEPTRSVVFRSAASLAFNASLYRDAEKLICEALLGNPPEEIADELRDLYEQVNFERHLKLRGVTLQPNELQIALSGDDVGFGMISSRKKNLILSSIKSMLLRSILKKKKEPFTSKPKKLPIDLLESVPRGASFAVSLRLTYLDEPDQTKLKLGSSLIE
ncbi:MAG: hypothetical protein SFU25_04970, partial [Candidatus Caenarcaniphilales bacterium]|nr:hypothetical protein [Candidatus Caenarcaniphilales bacterium]